MCMRKNFALMIVMAFVVLLLSFETFTESEHKDPGNSILVYHVNVIDVKTGKIASNKAILITGNRIQAIGDFAVLRSKNKNTKAVYVSQRF